MSNNLSKRSDSERINRGGGIQIPNIIIPPSLYIVIPCYNEELVLPITTPVIKEVLISLIKENKISDISQVLFVDDGSKDKTLDLLREYSEDPNISYISLSHNSGHQNALLAGMHEAYNHADAIVTIDADLQDNPNAIISMVDEYLKGADIVYGIRSSRKTDSFFKRTTAEAYYKFLQLMGVETIYNHADYRLLSKRSVGALLEYGESNLYLRGIVPKLGFKTAQVYYEREKRVAGESKYPLSKMINLAIDGITSTSIKPLKASFLFAIIFFIIAIALYVGIGLSEGLDFVNSILPSIFLCFSVLLFVESISHTYIGKIYIETKNRPKYFIKESIIHG